MGLRITDIASLRSLLHCTRSHTWLIKNGSRNYHQIFSGFLPLCLCVDEDFIPSERSLLPLTGPRGELDFANLLQSLPDY